MINERIKQIESHLGTSPFDEDIRKLINIALAAENIGLHIKDVFDSEGRHIEYREYLGMEELRLALKELEEE